MICSTSFLNKAIILLAAGFCLAGCAERCVVLGETRPVLLPSAPVVKAAPPVAPTVAPVEAAARVVEEAVAPVAEVAPPELGAADVDAKAAPMPALSSLVVLPVQNWSGAKAPLAQVEQLMKGRLQAMGLAVLDDARREECMRRQRVRDTSGISGKAAQAFQDEAGVQAILITCLEAFQEKIPPRVTLHARLVTAEKRPRILWADSVGLNGNQAPGLLALGVIKDPEQLLDQAVASLTLSLASWLDTARQQRPGQGWRPVEDLAARGLPVFGRRSMYLPRTSFRGKTLETGGRYTVAVIPFLNVSVRKYAEQIMAVHLVNELVRYENVIVLEPGVVREELLKGRAHMPAGPSLEVADLFFKREELGVNLIMSGEVFDYQDDVGLPKVDFSLQAFAKKRRETVWYSRSFNTVEEGWFFDVGRIYTAHGLSARMTRGAMEIMWQ